MGIERLFAATGRRDGAAAIEFVDGATLVERGMARTDALERSLAVGYSKRMGLGRAEAAHQARIDRQLMQLFDIAIANRDRHGRNALYDALTGRLALIDHGKLASFKKGLPPYNSPFASGPDVRVVGAGASTRLDVLQLELLPEVREQARTTDLYRIAAAFDRFASDVAGVAAIGHNAARPDETWLPKMTGVLDDAVTRGTIRYLGRLH